MARLKPCPSYGSLRQFSHRLGKAGISNHAIPSAVGKSVINSSGFTVGIHFLPPTWFRSLFCQLSSLDATPRSSLSAACSLKDRFLLSTCSSPSLIGAAPGDQGHHQQGSGAWHHQADAQ
jgi:hypothetical protein